MVNLAPTLLPLYRPRTGSTPLAHRGRATTLGAAHYLALRPGGPAGALSLGPSQCQLAAWARCVGGSGHPHPLRQGHVSRMPYPLGLYLGARRPTPTHGPAANSPRGAPDRAATPRDPGVHRAVCTTGRGGEQPLARHATLRSAPESVPGLSTHAPPAAPHGDRHEYRPGDRLAPR
jgi:hypothetical protein